MKLKQRKERKRLVSPIWQKAAPYINVRARKLANVLNAKTAKLRRRTLLLVLISIAVCWIAMCVYVGIAGFQHKGMAIPVTRLTVPKLINHAPDTALDAATMQALQRIHAFKQHIDSLRLFHPEQYRQLQQARPGLLDSLNMIEQYYSSNKQ